MEGMGYRDITLFFFIIFSYLVSFIVYLTKRTLICDKTASEDTMWVPFGGATFGMILVVLYAILVYTGMCGGYIGNDKQKSIAYICVSLLLVSSLGAEISIWKITKPDGSHQGSWVLADSEEICNCGTAFISFCLFILFVSWFYAGSSIKQLKD
jgi:hypothetical protein